MDNTKQWQKKKKERDTSYFFFVHVTPLTRDFVQNLYIWACLFLRRILQVYSGKLYIV